MTTYQIPIVAGVFDEEARARNAVEALRDAAFGRDQIGVAMNTSGPGVEHLDQDLMNLGVKKERAEYYHKECQSGHVIISVRPDGRDEEVRQILAENGAHDFEGSYANMYAAQEESAEA